jgi:hypothetical protein
MAAAQASGQEVALEASAPDDRVFPLLMILIWSPLMHCGLFRLVILHRAIN